MNSLKTALEYIRNLFSDPFDNHRKRRAPEPLDIALTIPRKTPRLSSMSTNFEDEWSFKRRQPIRRYSNLIPSETIVLDDEDENKIPHSKFTSTPAHPARYSLNGHDDDVKFPSESKSSHRTSKFQKPLIDIDLTKENGLFSRKKNTTRSPVANIDLTGDRSSQNGSRFFGSSRNSGFLTPSLDYSYRLDDKMNYKKLLDSAGSHLNSSSFYQTPIGKYISDVTSPTRSPRLLTRRTSDKLSTKDCIIKVLDGFDNEPVVLESDSDSDVIFVPPEPKPDIKVDPINSLKTIVDTAKPMKQDWLKSIVEKHRNTIDQRQREVDEYTESANKYNQINRDIRMGLLTSKINKTLSIKEVILPEEEIKEEIPLPPLTDDHLKLVQIAFSKSDPGQVLATKFNQNITRRDLYTLSGLQWLNDEVINFYMNLISERGKSAKWPNVYCMNTFFYPKLLKDGHQSLRRWTKKVDIFAHDLLCVPIHLGMHWCMAIVDLRDKTIRYYDSMGSPNNKCLNALRGYLAAEHLDKKKTEYDTSGYVLENVKEIPQQMNGSDCGMFACTFAEFLSRDGAITFDQKDMPYLRKKMVVEIMTGGLLIQ